MGLRTSAWQDLGGIGNILVCMDGKKMVVTYQSTEVPGDTEQS